MSFEYLASVMRSKINNAVKSRGSLFQRQVRTLGGFMGRLPKTPAKKRLYLGNTVKTF